MARSRSHVYTLGLALALLVVDARGARAQQGAGAIRRVSPSCGAFARPDATGRFLAREDLLPPSGPVDGDDLLVLVNRSPRHALASSYEPRDLVNVRSLRALPAAQCVPPYHQCLRREAALALRRLMDAMAATAGETAWIDSAYRGYAIQCMVFRNWAAGNPQGFCGAAVASALPGHSQHQLGTAVDLFTRTWMTGGARFREGFGCSPGGRWLAAHAWEHGFVLPYPLHPDHREAGSECQARADMLGRADPRTGYKYEPWHLRYIGVANAAAFRAAWQASGPGTAGEITLEQWLRARAHDADVVEPSVCDGCACESCATFHAPGNGSSASGPCAGAGLVLDTNGAPVAAQAPPAITDVRAERDASGVVRVRVRVTVPANTLTQPPVVSPASGVVYAPGRAFTSIVGIPGGLARTYPALAGAWRVAVGTAGDASRPWRAAIVEAGRDPGANGINSRIPAATGSVEVIVAVAGVAPGARLEVALAREQEILGPTTVTAP